MTASADRATGAPRATLSLVSPGHLRSDGDRIVAAFFDRRAQRYDASYAVPGPGRHVLGARMAAALELIGTGSGRALDVGMGAGRLCEALATRGWTVSGVDISAAMVRRAQARLPSAADRLRCAAIERLPFPDASFDAVAATGALEYVEDLSSALGELSRVLSPGARAVLSIPNQNAPYRFSRLVWDPIAKRLRRVIDRSPNETPAGIGGLRRSQFAHALSAAGFHVTAFRPLGTLVVPAPIDSLAPVFAERTARAAERRRRSRRAFATQLVFAATKRG